MSDNDIAETLTNDLSNVVKELNIKVIEDLPRGVSIIESLGWFLLA